MKNLSFFALKSGVVFTVIGIGIVTSALLPANAASMKSSTQANSSKLVGQSSDSYLAQKDEQEGEERDDDDMKSLPKSASEAILKEVSRHSGVDVSQLRIVKVERQNWSDGCLGLGGDTTCTQSLVPGWRVLVASGEQRWVYRANELGSLVKLDEVASRTLASQVTAQTTSSEQVTTRTTQTNRAYSDRTSQSRNLQTTEVSTGSSQSTEADTSQSTEVSAGSSQTTQDINAEMRQVAVTRSITNVSFTDISQSYWARNFIGELAMRGILTGFPDGKFHPNEPVTRAQFAAMLASVFKKAKVRNVIVFTDVSSSYWAYEGIRDAYEMGLIDVVSRNEFRPTQSLTRLEIVTMLAKALNYTTSSSTETERVLRVYRDAFAIPAKYRTLVAAATERGIMVNYPNVKTCSPNKIATRAEVAGFFYQSMVSTGKAVAISSPYVMGTQAGSRESGEVREVGGGKPNEVHEAGGGKPERQHCNQGIGNGAEGCDPGNSHPHGGSNDETGRTPGSGKPK